MARLSPAVRACLVQDLQRAAERDCPSRTPAQRLVRRLPHYCPVAAYQDWGLDGLVEMIWQYLRLLRIYTKPKVPLHAPAGRRPACQPARPRTAGWQWWAACDAITSSCCSQAVPKLPACPPISSAQTHASVRQQHVCTWPAGEPAAVPGEPGCACAGQAAGLQRPSRAEHGPGDHGGLLQPDTQDLHQAVQARPGLGHLHQAPAAEGAPSLPLGRPCWHSACPFKPGRSTAGASASPGCPWARLRLLPPGASG